MFLARQLLDFLKIDQEMSLDKVDSALISELATVKSTKSLTSTPQVRNLFAMLRMAAASCDLYPGPDPKRGKKRFVRVRLHVAKRRSEHNRLDTLMLRYDQPAALELAFGPKTEKLDKPEDLRECGFREGEKGWDMPLPLGSDFFDLDMPAQLQWAETLIDKGSQAAKSLRTKRRAHSGTELPPP
jgi:hypothetical protein